MYSWYYTLQSISYHFTGVFVDSPMSDCLVSCMTYKEYYRGMRKKASYNYRRGLLGQPSDQRDCTVRDENCVSAINSIRHTVPSS